MKLTTIIFDLDGTLIDSSAGVVEATNHALRKANLPERPADEISGYIGFPLEYMFARFTDKPVKELRAYFQERARESVVASTVALPDVAAVLYRLRGESYRLAIATTKIRLHIEKILAKLDWTAVFTDVIGGDDVARVKPHPEAIETLLERMNVDSDETIMVGDTINDILAARSAGVASVAIPSPYGGRDQLDGANPNYMLEKISELPGLVEQINRSRDVKRA